MPYNHVKSKVYNHEYVPDDFLDLLVSWAKNAQSDIFEDDNESGIYWKYKSTLGPWNGLLHRKAVMMEVLRVLAGFESDWNWNEGKDPNNHKTDPATFETGIFQVSANSMNLNGGELKKYLNNTYGNTDTEFFIDIMKSDHALAIDYAARLIQMTIKANGPLLNDNSDRESNYRVSTWLRRDSVDEFISLIAN